jgi:hypothetical protein
MPVPDGPLPPQTKVQPQLSETPSVYAGSHVVARVQPASEQRARVFLSIAIGSASVNDEQDDGVPWQVEVPVFHEHPTAERESQAVWVA